MVLRTWRQSQSLTLEEVARQVGSSKGYISQIESGVRRPGADLAKRIESMTNGEVTAAELLGLKADIPATRAVRETGTHFDSAPVKVAVPTDLAEMAREYGLDVEALIAEGGVPRLREAFKAAYIERHKEAIEWASKYVREHGTPSEQLGMI